MKQENVFINEADPVPSHLNFQLNARSKSGIDFSIIQPKACRSVIILVEVKICEPYLKKLGSMMETNRRDFIFYLMRRIAFLPAFFALNSIDEKEGFPSSMRIYKELHYNNLTECGLNYCMLEVVRYAIFVIDLLKNKLG